MNQIFIIFLLIILIIGVLYYYLRKEGFVDVTECLDLNFNTDDKSKKYNQIFSKVYSNIPESRIFNDPLKYMTFMNKDFNQLHQNAIASFLGLRDAINVKAIQPYQHYVVRHKMTVLFNSPVDKYLEITFNNFDNIPFVKIIYNHTEKKCIVENKLPDYLETPLVPGATSDPYIINLPNGFGTKIEFVTTTLRRDGVLRNQFGIIIDGNMHCYNLLGGIENHFYNALRNIMIYAPNNNINNTFTISHLCIGEIYASYAKEKIESRRVDKNANIYQTQVTFNSINGGWGGFSLVLPQTQTDPSEYALGSYLVRPGMYDMRTDPGLVSALILKQGDYVIPAQTYSDKWGNGGKLINNKASYLFINPNDMVKDINGTNYNFKGFGGTIIEETGRGNPRPNKDLALVREDCLIQNPNNITQLWNDRGSRARRDGSIWTYNHGNGNPQNRLGLPGDDLTIFQSGYNQPSEKRWIINDSCLVPQPQLLTDAEISNINNLVADRTRFYFMQIITLKNEKDAIVNPNIPQMNDSTIFKNQINQMINNSKSLYDLNNQANKNTNDMQNQYNNHYNFINLLKDTITPIKNNEKIMYNDYSPKINQITSEMDNKILSEPIDLYSEINNSFITNSKKTSDLVQQYNLQRDNDKILKFIGEQVSK